MATLTDHLYNSAEATAMTATSVTDEELLSAVVCGDATALATLYGRYSRPVFSVALAIVTDRAEAEELVQEAFLRVWLRARSYNPVRGRAGTWLLHLTRNLAIDQLRRRRLTVVSLEPTYDEAWTARLGDGSADDVEHEILMAEQHWFLKTVLRALPTTQRQVIEFAYFGGLTHAEVAAHLGLPLGTVKSRTCLAMRRLRQLLGRHADELPASPGEVKRRRSTSSDAAWLPAAS